MDEAGALEILSSISHPDRLQLLKALVSAAPEGMAAGDLARRIGASPSRASFHLSNMAKAGLVRQERKAREIIYRIDFMAIGGMLNYLLEDCCGRDESVLACCMGKCEC